jgi:glycerophosphoryl diester phosphodiesterase
MKTKTLITHLRQHGRAFLIVHFLFTLLGIAVLTPLFGLLLQAVLWLFGSAAVADQDIAMLLLSPAGLLAGILLMGVFLCISALELGTMQLVAQASAASLHLSPLAAARYALRHASQLLQLTVGLFLRVLVYLLPLLAVLFTIQQLLLADYDINFYLSQRPPQFHYALTLAAISLMVFVFLLGRRLLRWCLALPLTLFGGAKPLEAFAASERHTAGYDSSILLALLKWLVAAGLLSLVPVVFLNLAGGWVVGMEYDRLPVVLLALGIVAMLWVAINFLVTALNMATFTLVIAGLYERLGPPLSAELLAAGLREDEKAEQARGNTRLLLAAVAATMLIAIGVMLLRGISTQDDVLVIAHRGAAGAAPENTLAAVTKAMEHGADWVEIDVQETRDGRVIVVHDSDFMKLAGNPMKVWEGDLAEIQQIDIGSWYDTSFAAERPPTLLQVLEAIRGHSKLVIELKYYGHDQQLEQRVIDIVEAAGMSDDVVIMSLKLAGIQKVQALRPDWTTGLLAATAVGNMARLDVDFLAVNQNLATRRFIRRAHAEGKQVFVWTLNDSLTLSQAMSMGVDGVITDEPALARRVLAQRQKLSTTERLLLSAALFFGTPEATRQYRDDSP